MQPTRQDRSDAAAQARLRMRHVIELHTRRGRYLQTAGEGTAGTPVYPHQRLSLESNRTGPNRTGQGLLMLAHARQRAHCTAVNQGGRSPGRTTDAALSSVLVALSTDMT